MLNCQMYTSMSSSTVQLYEMPIEPASCRDSVRLLWSTGQQDISREVEAAAAAARAEAEAEAEENLNDLLACLGQEERKTER